MISPIGSSRLHLMLQLLGALRLLGLGERILVGSISAPGFGLEALIASIQNGFLIPKFGAGSPQGLKRGVVLDWYLPSSD